MAASLQQQFALGNDVGFQQRVTTALLAYAYQVQNEVGTTPNHSIRVAFANKVVANPEVYGPPLARLIAAVDGAAGTAYTSTSPALSTNVADSAITADVIIGFPLLAGA